LSEKIVLAVADFTVVEGDSSYPGEMQPGGGLLIGDYTEVNVEVLVEGE